MKNAINIYFTKQYDTLHKLDAIKEAGFDGVMLAIKEENVSLKQQVAYCKKLGLEICAIHCYYADKQIQNLWLPNKQGREIVKDYIKQIEETNKYNVKNFVAHIEDLPLKIIAPIGLKRIKRILKICNQFDINFCVENLNSSKSIDYVFNNIQNKNLKFCYDSGHENKLKRKQDFLKYYTDKTTVVHLHNNNGDDDEHNLLQNGTINLKVLANKLAKLNNCEFLTLEIKEHKPISNLTKYLKECKKQLDDLSVDLQNKRKNE